jgi:hypothetical protein
MKYAETMLEKIELEKKDKVENSLLTSCKRRRRGNKAKTPSDSNEIMLVFPFGADEEEDRFLLAENPTEAKLVLDQARANNDKSVNIAHGRQSGCN